MLNKHNIIQQGHNERHFLHISFINIMKSPSVGKGRERMEHRKMSAVSFIPWADLKIQVKKKKSPSLSFENSIRCQSTHDDHCLF